MIIHLKEETSQEKTKEISQVIDAFIIKQSNYSVLVTSSAVKEIDSKYDEFISEKFVFPNDMQLSSAEYQKETREIKIGDNFIGGNHNNTLVTIGPCGIESEEQIYKSAELNKELGLSTLRAGSYKPRTSPYSFQGMGLAGLKILRKVCDEYNLSLVTEVRDSTHVNEVIEYADVVQIGAKSMYNHGILRACSKIQKPVLLKRGFGTTLQEFVQASEFILSGGNYNVILCERGIRTFETKTRFTLDLCGASYLKEHTNLPIILDPSHAIGYAYGVPDLARACMAMGVEGILIEVHPNPKVAKSDASQQLNHEQFKELFQSLKVISKAINRNII